MWLLCQLHPPFDPLTAPLPLLLLLFLANNNHNNRNPNVCLVQERRRTFFNLSARSRAWPSSPLTLNHPRSLFRHTAQITHRRQHASAFCMRQYSCVCISLCVYPSASMCPCLCPVRTRAPFPSSQPFLLPSLFVSVLSLIVPRCACLCLHLFVFVNASACCSVTHSA